MRVDFYSLEPDSRGDRFLLSCRLLERIRASDLRVLVYCPDRDEARHLDRLLWTYRDESFLAHGLVGRVDPTLTPILISLDETSIDACQVVLNLSLQIPSFIDRFERVCEMVDHDPGVRAAGRERFRAYRERGLTLEHHPIRL